MDRIIAEKVEFILRDVTHGLDESIRVVANGSDNEEFQAYRRIAGKMMGEIFQEILQPIYDQFPDPRSQTS